MFQAGSHCELKADRRLLRIIAVDINLMRHQAISWLLRLPGTLDRFSRDLYGQDVGFVRGRIPGWACLYVPSVAGKLAHEFGGRPAGSWTLDAERTEGVNKPKTGTGLGQEMEKTRFLSLALHDMGLVPRAVSDFAGPA